MVKLLNRDLFDRISKEAANTEKLRKNYDLRDSENENGQRMLNILNPGSKTPIHRHQSTNEVVVCIFGSVTENVYDVQGNLINSFKLTAGSNLPGIIIERNTYHSLEATNETGVVLSTKAGHFSPMSLNDLLQV